MQVITDRSTGLSKGYGFVRFGNAAERDEALKTMDGHVVCNHPIRVSKATLKKYQADGRDLNNMMLRKESKSKKESNLTGSAALEFLLVEILHRPARDVTDLPS